MLKIIVAVSKSLFTRARWFIRFLLAFTCKSGLERNPLTKPILIFATVLITLSIAANVFVRHYQLQVWKADTSETSVLGAPSFSTADAPYFLRLARNYKRNEAIYVINDIRSYPANRDHTTMQDESSGTRDYPLLSVLIAGLSGSDDRANLLVAGNLMILITAAATTLMIAICFGAAGYWIEGAAAGLGGGLSAAYLVRSSIGRIDTDQLNLGFMYLMFGLAVFAGLAKSRIASLAWCAAAGLTANLFMWWYGKPELIAMATIALFWLLSCLQRRIVTVVIGTMAYIAISGIGLFNPVESTYLKDFLVSNRFIFLNTYETITEVQTVSFAQILVNATGSREMGFVCLTGLALFLVRHPVIAIAYGPLVAFGLLNFIIGNRAIFYSAPIMWFGAAFLMTTAARFIAANLSEAGYIPRRDQSATILAASITMLVAWVNSPTDYVPSPSFPKPVLEGLASLKLTASSANSVVATWWDYGYASMFFNDLPTFHDGGSQTTPATHFVATAFLNPDQARSIGNLKFLSTKGHASIAKETSLESLRLQFDVALDAPSPDLYLVVTNQMAGWISSISQIGNWDIETGTPVTPRGNNTGPQVFYEPLKCRLAGYPQRLNCAGIRFDLEKGLVNGTAALAGWAHAQDGSLVRRRSFDHDGDLALQIVQIGSRINVFFMHRQLFESTFNELYHLGQIDHPSISLHYDDYPYIRIYKMKGDPAS